MSDAGVLRFADPLGPRGRARVRLATGVAVVVLVVVLIGAVQRFADNGQLDGKLWRPFFTADAARVYGTAVGNTLRAAVLAMVLAATGGLALALGRLSAVASVRRVATVWVEFFRGIPLALLIVFLFVGLPVMGISLGNYWVLVGGLALYNSAVLCEIVRAGVLSLDRGQTEAALAIGLTSGAALRLVVLPQALRRMIPALVSQIVVVLKDTSLGVAVSYEELLRRAQLVGFSTGARLQSLLLAVVIYLVINLCLSLTARRLERRQGRVRRAARAGEIRVRGVEDLTV
jgi:glutamate transport system permease protein